MTTHTASTHTNDSGDSPGCSCGAFAWTAAEKVAMDYVRMSYGTALAAREFVAYVRDHLVNHLAHTGGDNALDLIKSRGSVTLWDVDRLADAVGILTAPAVAAQVVRVTGRRP